MSPCVWPLPWLGASGHRPDFLIGRALVFTLWNSDRFSRASCVRLCWGGVLEGRRCAGIPQAREESVASFFLASEPCFAESELLDTLRAFDVAHSCGRYVW